MAREEQRSKVHLRQLLRKVPPKIISGSARLERRSEEKSQPKNEYV